MKTSSLRLALCAGLLAAPLCLAQTETKIDVKTGQPQTNQGPIPINLTPNQPAPLPPPPFERLAKLGPDGKVIRLEGILDILAIPRNNLVDQATRDKIRPLVQSWMADVDQLAIDNLDFLEKIEPPDGSTGVIETLDVSDTKKLTYLAQMMTQLMSAGPLSAHLENKEGFTREQAALNQQIVSDYLQQVMNEIMAENGVPNDITQKPQTEEQKVRQVNAVSRFLYTISCRDAMDSYRRQLTEMAPIADKVIAELNLSADQVAKLKRSIDSAKAAATSKDKRKASREVLNGLTFDQRREALMKARTLVPPYDPVASLPASQAAAPATAPATPAAAAPAGATDKPGGN